MTFEQLNTPHASALDTGEIPSPATPEGDAISRSLPNAFYECAGCTQQGSESNCRPAEDIRLAPDETWLCEYCYDDAAYECGEDANWPVWADLPKLSAALRSLPPQDGAQCCMCGKKGLSTAEDGGPECELSDGRWVCSGDCWDRASDLAAPPVTRTYSGGSAAVQVCAICDISGCHHIRAQNAALTAQPVAQDPVSDFVGDAIRGVWGRCEALEDEAYSKLEGDLTEHELGFWRGQKMTAKSIRRSTELPATPAPVEAGLDLHAAAISVSAMVEEWYDGGRWTDHLPFHLIEKRLARYLRAQSSPVVPVTVGVDLAAGPDQTAVTLMNPSQAALDVLAERQRQISAEGWTPEHDDLYVDGEMAAAAACYAITGGGWQSKALTLLTMLWPWSPKWWKPTAPRRDLVKAGALILAEMERLDRLTPPPASDNGEDMA